ncbi:endonuclease III domain-containing protein [Listeria cossartiae]|uniref:endonuclease III domain-containing protein n=1 Tax=Listeria cossartiae TaxID=2838249 RepID=UPI00162326E4|nr:endonuclease III domain-containing protein [Listeria cossartiae]MBC1543168.1 endonuclease III domain-containing protein [Listeria cossartiae subsp. cossartiae]
MNGNEQKVLVLNNLVEHYGYQDWWEEENRLADWLSMILIQRTTEKNAKLALANLAPFLDLESLVAIDMAKLEELIYPAGFYKQKSIYIKALIQWFVSHGASFDKFRRYSTEDLRKELLGIKGVGEETADAMLLYIFERNVFIADLYARRLFTRLDFGEYTTYEQMREEFMPIVGKISHKLCKEWHSVIDVHGKHFGKNKTMDETWLLESK